MTVPRLGEGAYLGLGLVTPYTTIGANTDIEIWAPLTASTDNLSTETDDIVLEDLFTRADLTEGYFFPGQQRIVGTLALELNYDVAIEFLRMFTGDGSAPVGVGPYTYTFSPLARDDTSHFALGTTDHGMVIEVFRGGSHANSTFYQGCFPTELSFTFEPNGFAMLNVTFIGRTVSISAKSTPTMTGLANLATTTTGQATNSFTLSGVNYTCMSATITMRNGLGFRHDVTAKTMLLPIPEGKESSELQVDIEIPDDTLVTQGVALHVLFPTPNTFLLSKSANYSITFSFNKLKVVSPGEPRPQGPGPVRWNGTLRPVAAAATGVGVSQIQVVNQLSDHILTE